MKPQLDFLDKALNVFVATQPGAKVLHEIDVPGRKMMGVVVGVPTGEFVEYHCFGVRKSDGVITTRFDTPKKRRTEYTSFSPTPTTTPERMAHWERVALKNAALSRLARNFYRRVVKTPELLAGGMAYYAELTETKFVWSLCEQIAILNKSKVTAPTPTFPEWRGNYRFNLDGQQHVCTRVLSYNPETKLVAAHYTFFGGVAEQHRVTYGLTNPARIRTDENAALFELVVSYPDAEWGKTQNFVDNNKDFLRQFFTSFPVVRNK